jgi:NAD(P)-dependent dehydrogenase (short-subunit alcohol dehydrogenase family)
VSGTVGVAAAPSLEGAVAVVLGAGTGPDGAAIACTYASAGATVVVADIDLAAARATVGLISAAGDKATAARVDVTSAAGLESLASEVMIAHGRVDVLHNNVGISRLGSPPELSEEDWRLVLDTNLTRVFLACRAFLSPMRAAGRGSIVNTSSVAGEVHTGYDYSAYYAAKAGLNHFTRTLAVQLAPEGVRVNAVLPGMIDTPLIYRQISGAYASIEDMVAARSSAVPLRRMGSVWEVASSALFLASDAAAYVTGVCLAVDGGLSAS